MKKSKCTAPGDSRNGFTLVELLVVIMIIMVIAALVFLGSSRAIESAKIANNVTNLRNLGVIIAITADDYGSYPPGWELLAGNRTPSPPRVNPEPLTC